MHEGTPWFRRRLCSEYTYSTSALLLYRCYAKAHRLQKHVHIKHAHDDVFAVMVARLG